MPFFKPAAQTGRTVQDHHRPNIFPGRVEASCLAGGLQTRVFILEGIASVRCEIKPQTKPMFVSP